MASHRSAYLHNVFLQTTHHRSTQERVPPWPTLRPSCHAARSDLSLPMIYHRICWLGCFLQIASGLDDPRGNATLARLNVYRHYTYIWVNKPWLFCMDMRGSAVCFDGTTGCVTSPRILRYVFLTRYTRFMGWLKQTQSFSARLTRFTGLPAEWVRVGQCKASHHCSLSMAITHFTTQSGAERACPIAARQRHGPSAPGQTRPRPRATGNERYTQARASAGGVGSVRGGPGARGRHYLGQLFIKWPRSTCGSTFISEQPYPSLRQSP